LLITGTAERSAGRRVRVGTTVFEKTPSVACPFRSRKLFQSTVMPIRGRVERSPETKRAFCRVARKRLGALRRNLGPGPARRSAGASRCCAARWPAGRGHEAAAATQTSVSARAIGRAGAWAAHLSEAPGARWRADCMAGRRGYGDETVTRRGASGERGSRILRHGSPHPRGREKPDSSRLVRLSLVEAGFAVETAATGQHGAREAPAARADLVVLDLMLPTCPGPEVCRGCAVAPSPTICCADAQPPNPRKWTAWWASKLGADDYVTSPSARARTGAPRAPLLRAAPVPRRRAHILEADGPCASDLDATLHVAGGRGDPHARIPVCFRELNAAARAGYQPRALPPTRSGLGRDGDAAPIGRISSRLREKLGPRRRADRDGMPRRRLSLCG